MATLSFNCPNCGRVHDRIKPEMSGFKVKCQCGCVFRLGPKSNKDKAAFKKAIKSKRKSKTGRSNKAFERREQEAPLPHELAPPSPMELFGDEILDVIPDHPDQIEIGQFERSPKPPTPSVNESKRSRSKNKKKRPAPPVPPPNSVPLLPESLLNDIDGNNELIAVPIDDLQIAPLASAIPAATPVPHEHYSTRPLPRRRNRHFRSGGAIWTLILSLFGSLAMLGSVFFLGLRVFSFVAVVSERPQFLWIAMLIMHGVALIIAIGLTVSLIISGIMAIIELSTQTYRLAAIKWGGIFSAILLGCYVVILVLSIVGVTQSLEAVNTNGDISGTSQQQQKSYAMGYALGILIGVNMVSAMVPMATAITAWARSRGQSR